LMNRVEVFDYESAIEACSRGDRNALRSIYEREAQWLLAVAQRIVRDREVAREVLQDAFLQLWQRASTYQRALGSARGWIYTIVRHRALDAARRGGREIAVGDDLDAIADANAMSNADAPASDADSAQLQRCLEALDESRRDCVVLAFVEGYTQEQIAHKLAAPIGTVKSWIRRGLLSLKDCLS
ncbi:MAG: sigma-70 family RNA polymerase sigma factor, partial [Burkholderiaceae bacterium]